MEKKPDLVLNWTNYFILFYFIFWWKWKEFKVLKIQKTNLKNQIKYFITKKRKKKKEKKKPRPKVPFEIKNQTPAMYSGESECDNYFKLFVQPLSELESIPEESCRLYTVHTDEFQGGCVF
jgi:hypothetical protein